MGKIRIWCCVSVTMIFLMYCGKGMAQPEGSFPNIKMNVRIPTNLSNEAYKDFTSGVVEMDLTGQVPIYKSFIGGIGGKYTYTNVNRPTNLTNKSDQVHLYGGFAKLGYEKFLGERLFMELALNGGYKFIDYVAPSCDSVVSGSTSRSTSHNFQAFFIEPSLGFYVRSGDRLSFGASISYDYTFHEFKPYEMCLDVGNQITDEMTKGNLKSLNFGFGFVVELGEVQKQ